MHMYNLIEYSNNHSKTSGSLWKYYRDDLARVNGNIADFLADNNNSTSFKFFKKLQVKETIMVQRMLYFNCEINLILTFTSSNIYNLLIPFTKLYVAVVTSSTQDNAKLLRKLKSSFKRIVSNNAGTKPIIRLFN